MEMCCTAASACGPARRISPIWLTSKMPTLVRTAMCSLIIPHPIDAGYSTGMSQPLKSTIFAPIWRWTAFSAVLRTVGAVVSTADKRDLNQRRGGLLDGVTVYRITRFFGGSNQKKFFTAETRRLQSKSRICVPLWNPVSSVFKIFSAPELHGHARPGGYMRPRGRRLLPRHAAAYSFQLQAGVLSSLHSTAYSLAQERWDHDTALLDVQYHGSG